MFPVVNAKFESRSPKSPDNFRMRLFVLVTSAFATHAKSMASVADFQSVWLQLLALLYACFRIEHQLFHLITHSVATGPTKFESSTMQPLTPVLLRRAAPDEPFPLIF